jgi:O-antigen/teichoic acid export membrane protein
LGIQQLAIFSAIATLLAAGNTVTNAAGQAAAPRLAKCFALGDRKGFRLLLAALVVVSLGLGAMGLAAAFFFGQRAMALIYRPEYAGHQDVLLWLMAASGLFYLGSTLGYAVTAVRCFTPQLPLFGIAALTTAIACLVLVPSQGLRGAAMAILISAAVQCAGSAFLLWNAQRKARSKKQAKRFHVL